jgi:predicted ATPase
MHDLVTDGCQFLIATHSPLLMAYPGASIYDFTADGVEQVEWANVDTVRITTDFLAHPTEFLDELLTDNDDA